MKTFRRDNGGYALLYVLVVIVVLCAISASICTIALRNVQAQERSVSEMARLYDAEGEIERLAALAEDLEALGVKDVDSYLGTSEAETAYQMALAGKWTGAECTPLDFDGAGNSVFTVSAEYKNESVQINAELQMQLTYKEIPHYDDEGNALDSTYQISKAELKQYDSYTITNITD